MILIVSDRTAWMKKHAVRFHANGIYFYLCPPETAEFYCDKKDIGGVILDCIPRLELGATLGRRLHEMYPEMPIAAILPPRSAPDMPILRSIREDGDYERLFCELLDFCRLNCNMRTERLSTYYLAVERDRKATLYMGYPLPLSESEHKILRFLFYRSPRTTSADDIAEICYIDRVCRIDNIPVIIARINRHAAKLHPHPLIVFTHGKGYRLRDGILN